MVEDPNVECTPGCCICYMNELSTNCPDCLGDWSCELCWAQLVAALVAPHVAVVVFEPGEELSERLSTDYDGDDSSFELLRDDIIDEDGEESTATPSSDDFLEESEDDSDWVEVENTGVQIRLRSRSRSRTDFR